MYIHKGGFAETVIKMDSGTDVSIEWTDHNGKKTTRSIFVWSKGHTETKKFTFDAMGSHHINVTVKGHNYQSSESLKIDVFVNLTSIALLMDNITNLAPVNITLADHQTHYGTQVNINFGDGQISTDNFTRTKTYSHDFKMPGNYTVIAKISNPLQTKTLQNTVQIVQPLGDVSIESDVTNPAVCVGQTVTFSYNVTSGSEIALVADFGDSETANLPFSGELHSCSFISLQTFMQLTCHPGYTHSFDKTVERVGLQ